MLKKKKKKLVLIKKLIEFKSYGPKGSVMLMHRMNGVIFKLLYHK